MTHPARARRTAPAPPRGQKAGLGSTQIGSRRFVWGSRTFLMGIINVTPDSFSGDGFLAGLPAGLPAGIPAGIPADGPTTRRSGTGSSDGVLRGAVDLALAMAEAGADILDIGGESTRPGHAPVAEAEEVERVVPVIRAIRDALPDMPLSVDTTKPAVAAAVLGSGANLVNDVWGVADDDAMARVAAEHRVPIVLMHNRAEARYTSLIPEIVADLERAIERAIRAGVAWEDILIDPGFGFGKTAEHNLAVLRDLPGLAILGRPMLLGTSRKSTLGRVLDLPVDQRLEATLATTALAIAGGVDVLRVHDVRENVRAARMADAVVRGPREGDGA